MFRVVSHLSRMRLSLALFTLASSGSAQLSQDCTGLGEAMVEHSCFHATFGPFVSVPGTPGPEATADTPNVDSVHTEYRVGLPLRGEPHVVRYSPQRAGNWSIFTSADVPLQVLDDKGNTQEMVFQQEDNTGCDALPIARVYSLTAKSRYQLQLGPAELESVVLVIEYADDFLVRVGPDADGDGFGTLEGSIVSNCRPPEGFAPNTADCDDTNPDVHPNAVERCDGVDQNCNGSPDDVGLQCRAGSGACTAIGQFTCNGEIAVCDAAPVEPTAEVCNGKDDNCDGTIDSSESTLCTDADQPRCVRKDFTAFCGCLLDTDCGSLSSGRVCDVDSATCINGCSQQAGGNGCPDGQRCETEASPGPGLCVRDEQDEPAVPREQTNQRGIEKNPDAGCQCTLGHRGNESHNVIAGLIAVVFGWLLKKRRSSLRTRGHQGQP